MDERNTTAPSVRHRLETGSAARSEGAGAHRPMMEGGPRNSFANSFDAPRADSSRALQESAKSADDPRVEYLGFDEALGILRRGGRVARAGWNGKGQFLALVVGASAYGRGLDAAPVGAHIVIHPVNGELVPWTASQTDLLALDWCLVREETHLVYGRGQAEVG